MLRFLVVCTAMTAVCSAPAAPANIKDVFYVKFETTKGSVVVESKKEWAPNGVIRLYTMVSSGFFSNGIAMFRCLPGFVLQFGIHGDPSQNDATYAAYPRIADDRPKMSNRFGWLTFAATTRPNTRTTVMFFNLRDNRGLDNKGFAPIARCVQGCDTLREVNTEYNDTPRQDYLRQRGNAYIDSEFPNMDYITGASFVEAPPNIPQMIPDMDPNTGGFIGDVDVTGLDVNTLVKGIRVAKDKLFSLGGIKAVGLEAYQLRAQIDLYRRQRRALVLDDRKRRSQEAAKGTKETGLMYRNSLKNSVVKA